MRDEGLMFEVLRAGRQMDWGGVRADVIAPPPGELFSETNDNSVAILLAGDAKAREEEYKPAVRTRALKGYSTFRNYTHSEPRFCALLAEGRAKVIFHRDEADLSGGILA